jgi:putative membrane protein
MEGLINIFAARPYVLAIVVVFWVVAPCEIGWRRAGVWFLSGTVLGWLSEFSSTHTGFPFGDYAYHGHLFPDELWIGGVPPFASVSFASLTYFGYSCALTWLAPLRRSGGDVVRHATPALRRSGGVLLLAALIPTWLDTVVDPVTHLGRYWMLGDIYHYEHPGWHFDVPFVNYLGWVFTCGVIVAVNQWADRRLAPAAVPPLAPNRLPMQPFWSVGTLAGNMGFMLVVTVQLLRTPAVPAETPLLAMLASGTLLTAAFVAVSARMIRRGFARPLPAGG